MRTIVAGIDVGVHRTGVVALVRADQAPYGWTVDTYRVCEVDPINHKTRWKDGEDRTTQRLSDMAHKVDLAIIRTQPSYLAVELPFVRGQSATTLIATYGAILANAGQHLGPAAESVNIQTWKSLCGVSGKPKTAMLPVAKSLGYYGDDPEILDACGIALLAARRWEESR